MTVRPPSDSGTFEIYGLGEMVSASDVKPDIGPRLDEVRV